MSGIYDITGTGSFKCLKCQTNYYLNKSNGTCVSLASPNFNCQVQSFTNNTLTAGHDTNCEICYNDFYVSNNLCMPVGYKYAGTKI